MSPDGLVTIESRHAPQETLARLKAAIAARGLTLFADIDHAAGAASAGMPLRPTDLVIFGAAKGGTPLMQAAQTIGIDLPLKALVWQDAEDRTWVSYNDPAWLAQRHGLGAEVERVTAALGGLLKAISAEAAGQS